MAGCLACKACATQCPIHVDIPDFKARFQDAFFRQNRRPLRDTLLAGFEKVAGLAGAMAPVSRWTSQSRPVQALMAKLGLVDMPEFSVPSLNSRLHHEGIALVNCRSSTTPPSAPGRTVILLQDAFTSLFEPELVVDTCRLIRHLGYEVRVHSFFENGKALHIKGYLDRLRRVIRRNLPNLMALQETGYTLVAIEPSVALTYRDEYVAFGPEDARDLKVNTLQEWLLGAVPERKPIHPTAPVTKATLLPHCMESTGDPLLTTSWPVIFSRFGLELKVEAVGCCGMAGIYGHEIEHAETSRAIFDRQWRSRVENIESGNVVLATGFSCRHQAERCASTPIEHPVRFLTKYLIS